MNAVIVVAAGSSRRMGFNKLLAPLAGVPVLRRSLAAFERCAVVDGVWVVAGDEVAEAVAGFEAEGGMGKLRGVVRGGAERHLSVWEGLQALPSEVELVAVHDGARPLISEEAIRRCFEMARRHGAVVCARPMTETLKRADAEGRVVEAVSREGMWVMETPQVFERGLLMGAYEAVLRDGVLVTDEVSAVGHVGAEVRVVSDPDPNPKITFPADLVLAERLLVEEG